MTRINVVPVQELSNKHLVAEYREIMRLPNNLRKSLDRTNKPFCMSEIPREYVLGPGHVKFFYDKMLYLEKRFKDLVGEMIMRGYSPNYTDESIFRVDPFFHNDYKPTQDAIKLNRIRIKERS